jgi:hypothetical protein
LPFKCDAKEGIKEGGDKLQGVNFDRMKATYENKKNMAVASSCLTPVCPLCGEW